jgi:NADH-quinone oxidoreductase subunit E
MTFVLPDMTRTSFDPTAVIGHLMTGPLTFMTAAMRAQDELMHAWLALFGVGLTSASVVSTAAKEQIPQAPTPIVRPVAAKPKRWERAAPALDPAGVFDDSEVTKVAPKLIAKPKGKADDLLAIKGIGPKLNRLLNELGVHHYQQIAEWTPGEIAWINDKLDFKGRVQRERWVAQARALAKGR